MTNSVDESPGMPKGKGFLERFRESWFPPAAIVGAFCSFVTASFKPRIESRADSQSVPSPAQDKSTPKQNTSLTSSQIPREIEYSVTLVLGSRTSLHPFHRLLSGIAIGPGDRIYALGDGEVRVLEPNGDLTRNWRVPEGALCLAVGPDEQVYIGILGRVEIFNSTGKPVGGFAVGETGRPANITAIKVFDKEILVADATARYIRRYNQSGKQLGEIGTQNKTRSFMLPNRSLDMAIDAKGIVHATDTGRHQVTSWNFDGVPVGHFGKFGLSRPEDFVGCCNPVNIALMPDGKIVTAEKVVARVKVYDPHGKLLSLIGPEHFDPKCVHLYLAVDSKRRILVADPVRLEVKVFSAAIQPGGLEHA